MFVFALVAGIVGGVLAAMALWVAIRYLKRREETEDVIEYMYIMLDRNAEALTDLEEATDALTEETVRLTDIVDVLIEATADYAERKPAC